MSGIVEAERFARSTSQRRIDEYPEVEEAVVAVCPAYEQAVTSVQANGYHALNAWKKQAVAALRREDRYSAQLVSAPATRVIPFLLAVIAGATGFAGYFTRTSAAPLEILLPVSMTSVAVAALSYLFVVLPLRTGQPALKGAAFNGWVLLVLCVVPTWYGGYLARSYRPELMPWLILGFGGTGAVLILAVLANLSRTGRRARDRIAAADARAAEFREEQRREVARLQRTGEQELAEMFASLPEREALLGRQRELVAALHAQGIAYEPAGVIGSRMIAAILNTAASDRRGDEKARPEGFEPPTF